ncbi:MAG: hypothetical protein AAF713_16110 [Pseudomonadota bacterium]
MSVIPFDPKRRQQRPLKPAESSGGGEAKARIALLERALIATLRENAQNWARAERLETRVDELEALLESHAIVLPGWAPHDAPHEAD